jgi:hypothetical protein
MNITTTPPRLERDILQDAAAAIAEHDRLYSAMRGLDERITALCREYGDCTRRWGYAPLHLRRAVEARGLLS